MRQSPLEDVLSHWSKLIENFNTDSEDFYTAVDAALERRKIHDALTRYIQWSEGGILSPNREYFRIEGSGFAIDICAAPFGTGFFFSSWLSRKRPRWVSLYLLMFLLAGWGISRAIAYVIFEIFQAPTGDLTTLILRAALENPFTVAGLSILVLMLVVSVAARGGSRDPEEVMLLVPVFGWVYERWFAPVTFYSLDTAAMFRATVHAAVLEVIDDLITQKGLRALAPEDRKPLLDRLG
jgi:hypothetical protein